MELKLKEFIGKLADLMETYSISIRSTHDNIHDESFIISNNNIDLCELVGDIINSKLLREFNKNVNHSLEFINKLQGLMKNYNAIIVSENDYNYDIDGNYEYSFSGMFIQVDKKYAIVLDNTIDVIDHKLLRKYLAEPSNKEKLISFKKEFACLLDKYNVSIKATDKYIGFREDGEDIQISFLIDGIHRGKVCDYPSEECFGDFIDSKSLINHL